MRTLFIVNPIAAGGRALARWRTLRTRIDWPPDWREVHSHGPGDAVHLARAAVGRFDRVVAAGGDGTTTEVATGLLTAAQPAPPMALLPLGTGNDVARHWHLLDPHTSLMAIRNGHIRHVDVIRVESTGTSEPRFGLVYAAVGFAGELLRQTTPRVKRWFGARGAYTVGFLRAWLRFRSPIMRLNSQERASHRPYLLAAACNGPVAGGGVMPLAPRAAMDDGAMDLVCVQGLGRLQTLYYFHRLLRGSHLELPGVDAWRSNRLQIESDPPCDVQLDGDLFGHTPATFTLHPAALPLVTPHHTHAPA